VRYLSAGTVSGYAAKSHVSVISAANASAVPVGDATTGGKSTTPAIRSNAIVLSKRDATECAVAQELFTA